MTVRLSRRLDALAPSATVAITQRAPGAARLWRGRALVQRRRARLRHPAHIVAAAKAAVDAGHTRYTAARGVLALREAICRAPPGAAGSRIRRMRSWSPSARSTPSSPRARALRARRRGDHPDPLLGQLPGAGQPRRRRTRHRRDLARRGLEAHARAAPRGRHPAHQGAPPLLAEQPTGAAYGAAELRALADVAAEGGYAIIVDEIYAQLIYGDAEAPSILSVAPELRDRVVIVDGVSKTYAMTGWRIGWMLAPAPIARACDKLQGQATTNAASVAQYAAIAALEGPTEPIEAMRRAFEARARWSWRPLRDRRGRLPTPGRSVLRLPLRA